MDNPNTEFHRRAPVQQPDYHYRPRWCGMPGCGQPYNVQLDARTERFVSAATHLSSKDKALTIVVRCIGCGCTINQQWADECLTAAPEPVVYGRNHDEKDGPIL